MRDTFSLSAYLGGIALLFIAERIIGPGSVLRLPLAALAVLLVVAGVGALASRWLKASGQSRRILGRLLPAYGSGLISVGLYSLVAEGGPVALSEDTAVLCTIAMLLFGSAGTLGIVLMELSLVSMVGAPRLEGRRILEAGRAGVGLALALCLVGFANYLANEHDEKIDMRTVRDLDPSGATLEMVRNLSSPVTVTLAFPPANEVGEAIGPYFDDLDRASEMLTVERMDRDMEPQRAKEMRVRKNGTVVVSAGDDHKSIPLDVDAGKARSKLKKLDGDFQKRLAKVSSGEKIAYFVADHGERSTSPTPKDPGGLKTAKTILEQIGYKVKRLGLKEGLSDTVPDDARLVFLVGPEHRLEVSERDSLLTWVQGGGALMILAEPDTEKDTELGALLEPFGLKREPGILAHEKYKMRFEGGVVDRGFIFTNSFGNHPSTELLSKNRSKMYVVARNAGHLEKQSPAALGAEQSPAPEVTLTLKSMPGTWADKDGDFLLSAAAAEKRGSFALAAAVQFPKVEGQGDIGGRAVVALDADLIADLPMTRQGNLQWFYDSVRWLEDEIELAGEVADIEDVRILHSEADDALWFWGSTAAVPLLVLGVGALNGVRRRRRRS